MSSSDQRGEMSWLELSYEFLGVITLIIQGTSLLQPLAFELGLLFMSDLS